MTCSILSIRNVFALAIMAVLHFPNVAIAAVTPNEFSFGFNGGIPVSIRWFGESNRYYDLLSSENLSDWGQVDGFPKQGIGGLMEEYLLPADRRFFRMAASTDLQGFLLPEVASYKAATGITLEAANEINHFLRQLRGAGVEPALFWVGGSRYNSIDGSTARAVIGGNGSVIGFLGTRGERYESFGGNQKIRFANPLKNASQRRAGFFAGAASTIENGSGILIGGGETNPIGPRLVANWGGGNFTVFNSSGANLAHSGYGGYAKAGAFLPYVGGAYDGFYSVLCGIGKSGGTREYPLRFHGMPAAQFPNDTFVNSQDYIDLGSPGFSGSLYFAVVTAADLTDNKRAYEIISIPRRSSYGPYGMQTAVVFLGDSITNAYNEHVWNSDGMNPAHKGGGQWNRNCLGLVGNASGEGNDAQIEYFEKGSRYALDPRTWDNLFYVCGSGGHYRYPDHLTQNPLTQEAKDSIDAWIREYHEKIAIPAAELGATVVQMTYIYGCPNKITSSINPEVYRVFTDYLVTKQRELATAAGFPIFDVYGIPQLHEPLPAFYADQIHPNSAGTRLIAQEFAAAVANPSSRAPRSLSRPTISGTARVSQTLNLSNGSWAFTPSRYSYQWMRDATDIPGATAPTYNMQPSDLGYHISCRVTATNAYGSAERTTAHSLAVEL